MGKDARVPTLFHPPLSPEFCLRDPSLAAVAEPRREQPAYEWGSWPHSDRQELEIACRRLNEAQAQASGLTRLVAERTEWAQRLNREIEAATRRIGELETGLSERTAWALSLERDAKERTEWAQRLDREVATLAERAAGLERDVAERTQWAQRLDRELEQKALDIERLEREVNERSLAHARDLDRLAWAQPLDRRFHAPLDRGFRLLHGRPRGQ
jgi:hypothetical protein